MKLILHHIKCFTKSNWILLVMVTLVSAFIVGVYSLSKLTYLSVMIPFFIYYTQVQVLQKQQSIKYKLALPEIRSKLLLFIGIEFLILAIPQVITLQAFYHTLPYHSFYNPDRVSFFLYTFFTFWIYSIYLTGQWIDQKRREIIINKWEVFISNLYVLISSMIKVSLIVLYFQLCFKGLENIGMVEYLSRPVILLSFVILLIFLHKLNMRLYLKEELSTFYWRRQGVILGTVGIAGLSTLITFFYMKITANSFNHPVVKAVWDKKFDMAKELLKNKHEIGKIKEAGWGIQNVAIHSGDVEFLNYLIVNGLKLNPNEIVKNKNDRKHNGMNPFLLAIESDSLEMVQFISSKIKNINTTHPTEKYNGLHLAAFNCNIKMIDQLIELGVDSNKQNKKGVTPVMHTIRKGCFAGTAILAEKGVDFLLKDHRGRTVKDYLFKLEDNLLYLLERQNKKREISTKRN